MEEAADLTPQPGSRLAECVDVALADAEFPALSRHIQDIMSALKEDDAPAQRFASLVLQDYSLTLKVLRLANSFQYNRSRTPVESVSHAIVILGVRTIRAVASTLRLFDPHEKRSRDLTRLVLLSLLTAQHAGVLAELLALEDAEQIQLAALFRNLGEVLIACHFSDQYQEMLTLEATGKSLSSVCAQVMQFGFDDLSQAVGRQWQLPPVIFEGLGRSERPANEHQAAVAFAHDLTTLVYRRGIERGGTRLRLLTLRYRPWLALNDQRVDRILDQAAKRMRPLFDATGMRPDDLELRPSVGGGAVAEMQSSSSSAVREPDGDGERLREQVDARIGEIEAELTNFGPGATDAIVELAMKALYATGAIDRVLFSVVSPDRRELVGRLVMGDQGAGLLRQFRLPLSLRGGPIALSIMRRTPVHVDRQRKPSPMELSAADAFGAESFWMYPVSNDAEAVAGLYVDTTSQRATPSLAIEVLLERLCDLLSRAYVLSGRLGDRIWTAAERTRIVLRLLSGENIGLVSRETRVPVRELEEWKKGFIDAGAAQLGQSSVADRKRR